MDLGNLDLKRDYRTGGNCLLDDFFRPCLQNSNEYWRAVGYFSSSALEAFGTPLGDFVINGGSIRLITSVELVDADLEAIESGGSKEEISNKRIEDIIEREFKEGIGDGITRLLALIKLDRFEIKIAIPKNGRGIYHEKLGIFFDDKESVIAFSGSANESKTALEGNFESIDVYTSWRDPERAQDKVHYFEKLWSDSDNGAQVFSISEAVRNKLIRVHDRKVIEQLSDQNKWRHQDEAVEIFLSKERGILEMATGTGKTRTAFKIMKKLIKKNLIDTVIITMVGNDLLNQWHKQILTVRHEQEVQFNVFRHHERFKEQPDFSLNPEGSLLLCSRSVVGNALKRLSSEEGDRTLLIHDEVHKLGSAGNIKNLLGLSEHIKFRLGLSATPERAYDEEGNDFIDSHIGPVIYSFGLKEAIERGILAPFNYFPLSYELTEEDKRKMSALFAKKAKRKEIGNPMPNEELWREIARVYKISKAKLPIFEQFIGKNKELLERCIIFVHESDYGREVLDIVIDHRYDFHTYFSGEEANTLARFARGELECLVSCHRLSEGIDIQSLNNVLLFASDKSKLETIQRIGRCIRVDPQNPEKIANIVDFIRLSDPDKGGMNPDVERSEWLDALSKIRPVE